MQIPNDWEKYKQDKVRKFKTLSETKVWHLAIVDIHYWLANFKDNKEHQYLAYEMLDSVTHRNKCSVEAAYSRFIVSDFRRLAIDGGYSDYLNIDDWVDKLSGRKGFDGDSIRLAPVSFETDAGDSSQSVIRLLNSKLAHENKKLIIDENTHESTKDKLILLVDDFLGSGSQFKKYAKKMNLESLCENNRVVYAPAMGMKKGVDKINGKWGLDVIPLETITESHSIFYGDASDQFRNNNKNTIKEALECYEDMRSTYNYKGSYWFGYKTAKLIISFDWGCPNQTLGVFWDHKNFDCEWNNLLTRRQ